MILFLLGLYLSAALRFTPPTSNLIKVISYVGKFSAHFSLNARLAVNHGEGEIFKASCFCNGERCYLPQQAGPNPCLVKLKYKNRSQMEFQTDRVDMKKMSLVPSFVRYYGTAVFTDMSLTGFHGEAIIMEDSNGPSLCDEAYPLWNCYFEKLSKALSELNKNGLWHVGLSPENIKLTNSVSNGCNDIKIIDFWNVKTSNTHRIQRSLDESRMSSYPQRSKQKSATFDKFSELDKVMEECEAILSQTNKNACKRRSTQSHTGEQPEGLVNAVEYANGIHLSTYALETYDGCIATFNLNHKLDENSRHNNVLQANCRCSEMIAEFRCIVRLFPKYVNIVEEFTAIANWRDKHEILGFIRKARSTAHLPEEYQGPAVIEAGRSLLAELDLENITVYEKSNAFDCYLIRILRYMQELLQFGYYLTDIRLDNWIVIEPLAGISLEHSDCKKINVIDFKKMKKADNKLYPIANLVEALVEIAKIVESMSLPYFQAYPEAREIIQKLIAGRNLAIDAKCKPLIDERSELSNLGMWCSGETREDVPFSGKGKRPGNRKRLASFRQRRKRY